LYLCFRCQVLTTADCLVQCKQLVTRIANDRHTECVFDSVQDETTQGVDDCSLNGVVPSTSDFSDITWYKSMDMHNDLHVVETNAETGIMSQLDCRDECTSITLIAYCLAQYMSTLDREHQNHMQSLIMSETVSWISKLFR